MTDRGGRGQGSFVTFSKKKDMKDLVTSFSFASSASRFLSFPPPPPPPLPSCSPPGIRIHPYFSLE